MTLKEFANKLKVCELTVLRQVRSHTLPRRYKMLPVKTSKGVVRRRHLWFDQEDFDNYLKRFNG